MQLTGISRYSSIRRSSHGASDLALSLHDSALSMVSKHSESCIKGHRSSNCHHNERPLFEIKKKGRPVSQCDRCREARQSRRMHAKCTCDSSKESLSSSSLARQGMWHTFRRMRLLNAVTVRKTVHPNHPHITQWLKGRIEVT